MQQAQSQTAQGRAGQPALASQDFATLRRTMVDRQIRTYDVSDLRVVDRFEEVPREKFVGAGQEAVAYSDFEVRLPLEGGGARSLLAPLVAARALQAAEIVHSDRVLVVGDATGYVAALAAGLAASVVSLESDKGLSARAAENFASLGLNAKAVCGPLADGARAHGPFDVIVTAGALEAGLDGLVEQLAEGGRLVAFHPQAAGAARATLYRKIAGQATARNVFEAAARLLQDLARKPEFRF